MMWNVYVLESLKNGKRYVGISQDVNTRLIQHNSGKSKFTSGHCPWVIIYKEEFPNATAARRREKYLKSASGRRLIDKIIGAGSLPD